MKFNVYRATAILALVLFVSPLVAQFGIKPPQLATGTATTVNPDRLIILATLDGRQFVRVKIGSGLQLTTDQSGSIVVATAPTTTPPPAAAAPIAVEMQRQSDDSWTATPTTTGRLVVYRNGILQKEGEQYTRDSNNPGRIIPTAPGWIPDDWIRAEYYQPATTTIAAARLKQ
jgi:hypothetical protein